jgi:tetratricopeptide (TPR) repeat protein
MPLTGFTMARKKKQAYMQQEKTEGHRRSTRWVRWIRWSLVIISPMLFLLGSELLLALIGYGRPQHFFIAWKDRDRTVHLTNDHYCEHFVPRHLSRTPEYTVLGPKPKGTRRIFVLGGSAAYGDPEPAFGFCRQLEVLLNTVSEDRQYEVINAAVTAMNSHVARRIARDCLAHEPDLFIVYMGNNEVIGPYGPTTLPSILYARRGFINACMTFKQRSRLGQLMGKMAQAVTSSEGHRRQWQGMQVFLETQLRADDPKLRHCHSHFDRNLRDIVTTANARGVKTLLCTVPINLSACPPFGSLHEPNLRADRQAEWQRHFETGRGYQQAGVWQAALAEYEQAAALDNTFADLIYCQAQCLDALGRITEAQDAYSRARDLDTLRFRASSDINATIRMLAPELSPQGARLFDLELALREAFETLTLGDGTLVDHVHLSVRGNFLAACAALDVIHRCFPDDAWTDIGPPETLFAAFATDLLYDYQQPSRLALLMYRRKTLPPFVNQLDHDREMERLREALYRGRAAAQAKSLSEAEIRTALTHRPHDPYLQQRYGAFLLAEGHTNEAIDLYETFLQGHPYNMTLRLELAPLYAVQGDTEEALDLLTSHQSPYRYTRRDALLALAVRLVKSGQSLKAESLYRDCLKIDPDNVDALINLAVIAGEKGALNEEKRYLDRALALVPDSSSTMVNMGNHYVRARQSDHARTWFARAVKADPYNHLAHIGLGIQTMTTGQVDEGISHVIQAVKLKPDFAEGYTTLETLYQRIGLEDKAESAAALHRLFTESPP